MQTDGVLIALCRSVQSHDCLPWLTYYIGDGSCSSYSESGPPESKIDVKQIGPWLLVTASINYEGATYGYNVDRIGGDPYVAQVRYDWIGPAASAPKKVLSPEEFDAWAVLSLHYVREYTDVGTWGVHQGSWVESLNKDGTVSIREASGRFQDESPESKSTARTVKLELPRRTSS